MHNFCRQIPQNDHRFAPPPEKKKKQLPVALPPKNHGSVKNGSLLNSYVLNHSHFWVPSMGGNVVPDPCQFPSFSTLRIAELGFLGERV